MMRSRFAIVMACLVLGAALADAQPTEWTPAPPRVSVLVTWDLGLRVGVEYRPLERAGLVAEVGSTLFSLEGAFVLTYDAFVVFYGLPPESDIQLNACLGIPDGRYIFGEAQAGEIAFGASAHLGYRATDRLEFFLRAGAGVPFFWDEEEPLHHRATGFPFGIWPDLSLGTRWQPVAP